MDVKSAYQWLHGDRLEYSGCRAAAEAMKAELDRLRAERDALRSLCAAAYQVVGAVDGPLEMLDNLLAAANTMPLPHEPHAGLPWTPNAEVSGGRSPSA